MYKICERQEYELINTDNMYFILYKPVLYLLLTTCLIFVLGMF